jgi:hypothetical protein
MQRPVMDPLFVDTPDSETDRGPGGRAQVRRALRLIVRGLWTLATVDLFVWRSAPKVAEEPDNRWARLAHGVIGKLALLPVAVLVAVGILSWIATHPPELSGNVGAQLGAYHEPIGLVSEDGTRLEAFLVQPLSAERVLAERDRAIGRRYPAVVLVHDYASNAAQMAAYIAPLRDAGYVVLAINTRGSAGSAPAARSFGLNESADVRAAVRLLQTRPFVDPSRIAIVGAGTGANAALLASVGDVAVRAVVLDSPVVDGQQVIDRYVVPPDPKLAFLRPICRLVIEGACSVDFADLRIETALERARGRGILVMGQGGPAPTAGRERVRQVLSFLQLHMNPPTVQTVVAR